MAGAAAIRRLLAVALTTLACGVALAACAPQAASPYRTVLLITDDGDPASLARNSPPALAVIDGTASQLSRTGFSAYDEAAVGISPPGRNRVARSDSQMLDQARGVTRPPMDALVAIATFPETTSSEIGARVRLRADARVLDVATGRRLGTVSITAEPGSRTAGFCDAACLDRLAVENAGILSGELGPAIAAILSGRPVASPGVEPAPRPTPRPDRPAPPPAPRPDPVVAPDPGRSPPPGGGGTGGFVREWVLTFNNFDSREVSDAEDYLVIFTGYRGHRPAEILGRRHVIWYTSTSDPARLMRNMNRMVSELGVRARITASGNEITVDRLPVPGSGRRAAGPSTFDW